MAAPHVAGAFAILKQAVPGASVSQMLQALQGTGLPITDVTGITTPRIQIDAALDSLASGPPGVSLDWAIQDVGDFNGDGKADILWRHTSGVSTSGS